MDQRPASYSYIFPVHINNFLNIRELQHKIKSKKVWWWLTGSSKGSNFGHLILMVNGISWKIIVSCPSVVACSSFISETAVPSLLTVVFGETLPFSLETSPFSNSFFSWVVESMVVEIRSLPVICSKINRFFWFWLLIGRKNALCRVQHHSDYRVQWSHVWDFKSYNTKSEVWNHS